MIIAAAHKNTLLDILTALVNGGSIVVQTAGSTTLATITLANPAFGAAAAGVATAAGTLSTTVATAGTMSKFIVKNSGGTEVWRGTCGLTGTGADLESSSLVLLVGEVFELTGWTVSI